ncbi:diphthine--ammonia ligase [Candidatus Pacearchaeota archaeon]|nr:diphthine--ammonia ligase [Candidatus Pacearchaeota archaeon]
MKLGVLFSGGKDSTFACYLAKKQGYEISCLISIFSENKESWMFHTPSIEQVKKQAEVMNIPLIIVETKGEKEKELLDLEKGIKKAIENYKIEGVVTGAVESVYQSSRIQNICNKLDIECFNPLWLKVQEELLKDIIKNKFEVIITGVFAFPFGKEWLGRKIDKNFIKDIKKLYDKYSISISGEGGETESFVVNCTLFKRKLRIINYKDFGSGNSWRRELIVG